MKNWSEEYRLKKLADSIVDRSVIINWPHGKVGAIQKMTDLDKDLVKNLKPKHFNHSLT